MANTQITVRIPDDLAAFIDGRVGAGVADSRASVVVSALRRERRRLEADRDAGIYAVERDDPDLDALAAYAAAQPMDLD
jgi:Arc/MetJ-type ribon-helix-helix transcriptional regulator